MRTLALTLTAALALVAPCSAEKSAKPASRRPTAGRAFFGLVIRHGMRIDGKLVEDPALPTDRPYKLLQKNGSLAALDSSICLAMVRVESVPGGPPLPGRVIDRGCTGLLSSSTVDWEGHVPVPMTQSDLDAMYSRMTRFLFEK